MPRGATRAAALPGRRRRPPFLLRAGGRGRRAPSCCRSSTWSSASRAAATAPGRRSPAPAPPSCARHGPARGGGRRRCDRDRRSARLACDPYRPAGPTRARGRPRASARDPELRRRACAARRLRAAGLLQEVLEGPLGVERLPEIYGFPGAFWRSRSRPIRTCTCSPRHRCARSTPRSRRPRGASGIRGSRPSGA